MSVRFAIYIESRPWPLIVGQFAEHHRALQWGTKNVKGHSWLVCQLASQREGAATLQEYNREARRRKAAERKANAR